MHVCVYVCMYDIVNEPMSNAGHHYCVVHWALTSPLRLDIRWVLFCYSNLQGASPFNVSRGSTHLISPHHILLGLTVASLSCSSCFRFMWNLWHLVWASPFPPLYNGLSPWAYYYTTRAPQVVPKVVRRRISSHLHLDGFNWSLLKSVGCGP